MTWASRPYRWRSWTRRRASAKGRFRTVALLERITNLEGRIDGAELVRRSAEREEALAKLVYTDETGAERPLLTENERAC